ncbi:MAG: YfhO family protein [Gemmatimonadota bacterium]|nr:YfhO family protein [Gemmatimonadota bacterium]
MNGIERTLGARGWWPAALLALICAVYLWEIVTLTGVPIARDMQGFFVPQKFQLWQALRAADLPLWTPYVGTGAPFLANFQTGVFYPPNWAFAALPFLAGFNALVAFHFVSGAVFAWLLSREMGFDHVPAFIAATTWTLGGYFVSLLNLMNALQAATWAPALTWAALVHLRRRSAGSLAGLAVIGALGFLAGEPQTFLFAIFTAVVAVTLAGARHAELRRGPFPWVAGVGAAAVLVLGLVAIQVLPTLEFLVESSRGGGGLTLDEASAFPLEPVRLVHLIVPPDYGDPDFAFGYRSVIGARAAWLYSIYMGPVWLLLYWFAWRDRDHRREVVVWTAMGVAGTVVALGAYTPVYPWLFEHVPGFGAFRFPEKYFFVTAFSSMLLAGYGARALLARRGGWADAAGALALLGVVIAARVAFALGRDGVEAYAATHFANARMFIDFDYVYGVWGDNLSRLVLLAVIAVLLTWIHRRGWLRTSMFGVLLAVLLVVDLFTAHRHLNPVADPEFYERAPLIAASFPLDDVRLNYRYRATDFGEQAGRLLVRGDASYESQKWLWQQTMAPNVGQRWGVLQPDTWDAIKLTRNEDERALYRILADDVRRWRLLRLMSVRYLYNQDLPHAEGHARPIPLEESLPGYLYELENPLPRAYTVFEARTVPNRVAAINAVLDDAFDPTKGVILIDPTAAAFSPEVSPDPASQSGIEGGSAGGATIVFDSGDEVRVRLEENGDGHLVLTDSWFPGWRAYVDGRERQIELANFFFRAVPIEAGDREVVFRYLPSSFETGRMISVISLSIASLVGLLGVVGIGRRGAPFRPKGPQNAT